MPEGRAPSTPLSKREVIAMRHVVILMILIDVFMMFLAAIIIAVK